jgi:hypothetical protein
MKLFLVADCHIGNHKKHGGELVGGLNERCRETVAVLHAAAKLAHAGGGELWILGDLFDTSNPTPQLVAACADAVSVAPYTKILLGNHDMISTTTDDNALASLGRVARIEVIERTTSLIYTDKNGTTSEVLAVPFRVGSTVERFKAGVASATSELWGATRPHPVARRAVMAHIGIESDKAPAFMRGHDDAAPLSAVYEMLAALDAHVCFAGNWHSHAAYKRGGAARLEAVQIGALVPTGWDNYGTDNYGSVVVYDTDNGDWSRVELDGPRFLRVEDYATPAALATVLHARTQAGLKTYLRRTVPAAKAAQFGREARAELDAFLGIQSAGTCVLDVQPNAAEVRDAVRDAAATARSASTLEDALAKYVEGVPCPDGVARADVLASAKRLLMQAQAQAVA